MRLNIRSVTAIVAICLPPLFAAGQNKPKVIASIPPSLTANYPDDAAGVLIKGSEWAEISEVIPSNSEVKHGLAAALAGGLIPSYAVAQFDGQHAAIQLGSQRPVICICHPSAVPAGPLLVKLHAKKGYRELYGSRMYGPGARIVKAKESDTIPADLSQPEKDIWLLRPKTPLPAGEYAVMIGNQDFAIFPFTVSNPTYSRAPTLENQ